METKNIRLGQVWIVETTKGDVPFRLERIHPNGGWTARALTHGRTMQIKSESQLLQLCSDDEVRGIAQGVMPKRRSKIQGPVYREPMAPLENGEQKTPFRKLQRPKAKEIVIVTRLSLLDAAHRVLSETKRALTTREIIAACVKKRYWSSDAPTPWQTLNAALNRDLAANGNESRFVKTGRGIYTLR